MYEVVDFGYLGAYWGSVKIKTTIATNEEEVNEVIQALMSNSFNRNRLIGLDLIPIRSIYGFTSNAILQLCDSTQCLILRLYSVHDVPQALYNFLILPGFTFAGFGIKDTVASLKKDYHIMCKNVLEVGGLHNRQSRLEKLQNLTIPHISNISKLFWGSNFEPKEDEIKIAVSNVLYAFHLGKTMLDF